MGKVFLKIALPLVRRGEEDKSWSSLLENNLAGYPDDDIGREIAIFGQYEALQMEAIEYFINSKIIKIKEDSIFMDIGANIGIYSCKLSKYFPFVMAFEPHPITFRLLSFNVESNNLENIDVIPYALSNKCEELVLVDGAKENRGSSSISLHKEPLSDRSYKIQANKGDVLLSNSARQRVSFIKIDVEGHEIPALEGCDEIINLSKPVIAFEANDLQKNLKLIETFKDFGYCKFMAIGAKNKIKNGLLNQVGHSMFGKIYELQSIDLSMISRKKYQMIFAIP